MRLAATAACSASPACAKSQGQLYPQAVDGIVLSLVGRVKSLPCSWPTPSSAPSSRGVMRLTPARDAVRCTSWSADTTTMRDVGRLLGDAPRDQLSAAEAPPAKHDLDAACPLMRLAGRAAAGAWPSKTSTAAAPRRAAKPASWSASQSRRSKISSLRRAAETARAGRCSRRRCRAVPVTSRLPVRREPRRRPGGRGRARWRRASKRNSAAATLTLRLSTGPCMGIAASSSQVRATSGRSPRPSAPNTRTTLAGEVEGEVGAAGLAGRPVHPEAGLLGLLAGSRPRWSPGRRRRCSMAPADALTAAGVTAAER